MYGCPWLNHCTVQKTTQHCELTVCRWVLDTLARLCPVFCGPMGYSWPGSSVHGIFRASVPEWVRISYSRGSSWPRDRTCVSWVSCTGRQILYHCTTRKALNQLNFFFFLKDRFVLTKINYGDNRCYLLNTSIWLPQWRLYFPTINISTKLKGTLESNHKEMDKYTTVHPLEISLNHQKCYQADYGLENVSTI